VGADRRRRAAARGGPPPPPPPAGAPAVLLPLAPFPGDQPPMLGRVFKAYDIRGTYPDLLNEQMAWQIGYGASKFLRDEAEAAGETTPMMRNIVVGRDMRKSSPSLSTKLIKGINDQGGDVIDVGLVDTPFVYFAINHLDCACG